MEQETDQRLADASLVGLWFDEVSTWPEYIRDEIDALEAQYGVRFTSIADPVREEAEAHNRWLRDKEFYRWHRFDGTPRKLGKNGKPRWRRPSKRHNGL